MPTKHRISLYYLNSNSERSKWSIADRPAESEDPIEAIDKELEKAAERDQQVIQIAFYTPKR